MKGSLEGQHILSQYIKTNSQKTWMNIKETNLRINTLAYWTKNGLYNTILQF
jgi:hypothetical protein